MTKYRKALRNGHAANVGAATMATCMAFEWSGTIRIAITVIGGGLWLMSAIEQMWAGEELEELLEHQHHQQHNTDSSTS